jgi:hypothetical protein
VDEKIGLAGEGAAMRQQHGWAGRIAHHRKINAVAPRGCEEHGVILRELLGFVLRKDATFWVLC